MLGDVQTMAALLLDLCHTDQPRWYPQMEETK